MNDNIHFNNNTSENNFDNTFLNKETTMNPTHMNNSSNPNSESTDFSNLAAASSASSSQSNPSNPSSTHSTSNGGIKATSWMSDTGKTVIAGAPGSQGHRRLVWKKVTQGGVTGLVLGTTAVLLATPSKGENTETNETDSSEDLVLEGTTTEGGETNNSHEGSPFASVVDSEVSWADNVNDDMSFSQAFAAARAEVGPGGVFEWRGQLYGTYYGEEWDNMSAAERAEYNNHFTWSAQSHTTVEDEVELVSEPEVASVDSSDHSSDHFMEENEENEENEVAVLDSDEEEVAVLDEGEDASESEVEILGIYQDEETGMTYGGMAIDGQEVLLIDVESDGEFDYAVADLNQNGQIEENEIFDLSEESYDDDLIADNEDEDLYDDDYSDDGLIDDDIL